ncbi:MAG TPA: hypothetical protein VD970_00845 [Acetobacteraceae bacterium]|nr:hypothetical protein [Acetobacteraceae bacterium]
MMAKWFGAVLVLVFFEALAAQAPRGGDQAMSVPIPTSLQLAQSCVCHNPVGTAGETFCRNQRIVRCRRTTQNLCGWDVTSERC